MLHYIDHNDRQGKPRTACGQLARHVWTPTFWDRAAFLSWSVDLENGTGPADRCPHCVKVATGTKHTTPRTFDEYAGTWAIRSEFWDIQHDRPTHQWQRLHSTQHARQWIARHRPTPAR
jgi:hypothetical protein